MATQKRKPDTSVEEELYREPYLFSFFKAVDLVEKCSLEKDTLGAALVPSREAIRFTVKPGFTFPPSEIVNLERKKGEEASRMSVAFMGLVGPLGILPHWYNNFALQRIRHKDHAFTDFLDMFHHRLISLFYLAWKKYRFPENYQPGAGDRLSGYILSLAGLGTKGMVGALGLPREALTFYSGLLLNHVASAKNIEAAVEYFSGLKTWIDQFIERELALEEEDQTRMGLANACLGQTAVCGKYVKECQTKFRVNLGPAGYTVFLRLLPVGDLLLPLFSLIRYMVGIEFEFEIRIFLKKEEVPPTRLGGEGKDKPLLGWSTWISSPDYSRPKSPYLVFQEHDLKHLKKTIKPAH